MSRIFLAFVAVLSIFLISINPVQAHGWKTPEDAINAYITAVKTGSGEHIEMAFTESASIQYYDQKGEFNKFTRDEFAKMVDSGNQWDAKIEITAIKKVGKAANATVEFTWGETFDGKEGGEKGYVDFLNLIYDDKNSWHITDKVAQFIDR